MAKQKNDNPDSSTSFSESERTSFLEELEGGPTGVDQLKPTKPAPRTVNLKSKKILVADESTVGPHQRHAVQDAPTPGDLPAGLAPKKTSDMGTMQKAKRSFPWPMVLTIVAILAVVSVAGFFVFNRAKKFTNNNVQVQFVSTTGATSGSTYTVKIEYQNLEPVDLTQAQLAVQYPEGFTYTSSTPNTSSEFHNAFSLGTIRSGQAGSVTIQGILLGAVNTTASFHATLSYRPSTFNSDFQQKASTDVTIASSIVQLTVNGPTQLAPGAAGTWTIAYENTSDRDLSKVRISATYPNGLSITSTKPAADSGTSTWNLASIKKGAKGTITITGTVDGNIGDTITLLAKLGLVGVGDVVEPQNEQSVVVMLVKTGLSVSVAVNGSTDPVVIQPGDSVNYSVRVANASDVELTNATITAKIDGVAVDTGKIANDTNATVSGSTFTWTKDTLAALASFKPTQSVTLSFGVGTLATIAMKNDADRDQHVTLTLSVSAPGLSTNSNSSTPPTTVVTKIATALSVATEARMYENQNTQVGSGPTPPVVGQTTSYRITWTVTNTTSDATAMTVTGRLPNSVLWTGKNVGRDAGDIAFDPSTRMVTWTLNTLPAGTGGRLPKLTAHFEVSITPTTDQVGTVPILMETTTIAATDSYSKQPLSQSAATVTTDIPNDPKVANQGSVIAS